MQNLILDSQQRSATHLYFANAFRYPTEAQSDEQQQLDYVAGFDCSVYKSACSLHEAAYTTEGQEVLYEELTRFYEFFGLGREHSAELPDHLSVELEFMHFLSFLEAQDSTDEAARASLLTAQRDFFSRHLAQLTTDVADNFSHDSAHYRELLEDLQVFMDSEKSHFGLAPGR